MTNSVYGNAPAGTTGRPPIDRVWRGSTTEGAIPRPEPMSDVDLLVKKLQNWINLRMGEAARVFDVYRFRNYDPATGWGVVTSPQLLDYRVCVEQRKCSCPDAGRCAELNSRARSAGIEIAGGVECKHLTIADIHIKCGTAERLGAPESHPSHARNGKSPDASRRMPAHFVTDFK